MKKSTIILLIVFTAFGLSGCLKDPSATISIDKAEVAIDEEVTVTLSNVENYTCIGWRVDFNGETTQIAGGTGGDQTYSLSFKSTGEATISALVKNCKKSDDKNLDACICEKNHITTTYDVMVTIK